MRGTGDDPDETGLLTSFCGVSTEFICADGRDTDHLRYYLSDHLVAGRTEVKVYAPSQPGGDFLAVEPELTDVYFLRLSGNRADGEGSSHAAGT